MELEQLVEMLKIGIRHRKELPDGVESVPRRCSVLEEWRKSCIPEWRVKLKEHVTRGDREGERDARWMLREILLDPDYSDWDR